MPHLYGLDPLSQAEQRLLANAAFGVLNYPDNNRDAYFKQGFALIRRVNQPERSARLLQATSVTQRAKPSVSTFNTFCEN